MESIWVTFTLTKNLVLTGIRGLKTEGVIHHTDVKPSGALELVILCNINRFDLTQIGQ